MFSHGQIAYMSEVTLSSPLETYGQILDDKGCDFDDWCCSRAVLTLHAKSLDLVEMVR